MPANYVLLERFTLTANAASVTFDNIPQTGYTDLVIKVSGRGTQAAASNALTLRFNGATTGYSSREVVGDGSNASSATRTLLGSALYVGNMSGNSATASTYGSTEIYIPKYASSSYKSLNVNAVSENNGTEAYSTLLAGLWSNNAAITSIELISLAAHGNLMTGSSFSLYGVAAVGTTPVSAPKAAGGDIVESDGTYWYHTFLNSNVFTPNQNLTCDYLVVAGGAGGGGGNGGGGGAGGLRSTVTATGGGGSLESALSLTASTNYVVTIGAGGIGGLGTVGDISGTSGSNSVFGSITSAGGGGGAAFPLAGVTGGSGGGGCGQSGSPIFGAAGAGTVNQGYAGGAGNNSQNNGGGGGGAGSIGSAGSSSNGNGGNGGNGVAVSISGSSLTYAGGGGGGARGSATPGTGGTGGGGIGGTGAQPALGGTGTVNTGSGGGGGGGTAGVGNGNGGNGGSGIVVVRYAV